MPGFSLVLGFYKQCDASGFDANQSPLSFVIVAVRSTSVLGIVVGKKCPIKDLNVRIRSWTSVWRSNGRTPSPFLVRSRTGRLVAAAI